VSDCLIVFLICYPLNVEDEDIYMYLSWFKGRLHYIL